MKFLEDVSLSACVSRPRPVVKAYRRALKSETHAPGRDRARTDPRAARENSRARTFFHSFAGSKKMGPKGRTGRDPSRPRSRV